MLYRSVLRVLRDAALSEEVVQEVYVEIWRDRSTFDPSRGSLAAWSQTIARRRAIDRVRAVRAARDHDDRFARLEVDRGGETVEEVVTRRDEYEQVRAELARLSEDNREMLSELYWQGHTYRELAARLGIPLGTLKTRVHVALVRLRRSMSD
jgi:RNA polymerase sigma-70 factor (ECF subfamily)